MKPLARLTDPRVRHLAPLVVALQMLAALTEGLGLVLLVPMLGLLADPGDTGGAGLAGRLADFGLPTDLASLLALFVMLVAIRSVLVLWRNRAVLELELKLVDGLRRRAWASLLHADWRLLSALRRSDQASLLISNLDRVGLGINQLLVATTTVVTLLALGLAALAIAPLLALGAGLSGLLVLLAYRGLRRRATQLGEALGTVWNRLHAVIGESLAALRTIKLLGGEDRAEAAVMDRFAALGEARHAYLRSTGLGQLFLQTVGAAALALLVWFGLTAWNLPLATILPMVALFARALPLLGTLQEAWQRWLHARPALAAAQQLIAETDAARQADLPAGPPLRLERLIALDRVRVQFAGQPAAALEQVSLEITAGSIVALIGPSGAGKSTLADLLAGLTAPDTGQLILDGQPLDPAAQRAWRGAVAYVEQDPLVLAASLRDNLRWAAPEADDARLWTALEDAAAAAFVRDLPAGLDTLLGDGGRQLSGGERQRLMLARALLRDPQLLILDEATSALDPANEAAIATALGRLRGRMTIVLIAHRGALTRLADRVVRLESGHVVDESAG